MTEGFDPFTPWAVRRGWEPWLAQMPEWAKEEVRLIEAGELVWDISRECLVWTDGRDEPLPRDRKSLTA